MKRKEEENKEGGEKENHVCTRRFGAEGARLVAPPIGYSIMGKQGLGRGSGCQH